MYDIAEDRIILRLREMLAEWLAREEWHPQQLIEWLQGYDLPPVGHDDEPYLWLLRGLPVANERYEAEVELANRVARILEDEPDRKRPGTRPDQVLYNLFMLCAGLSCPDQLADSLYGVFQRGVLEGEWLGVDLRYALQIALILNQSDDRLLQEWEAKLDSRKQVFLPGSEYDGFEGIRLIPSVDGRGKPALDAIGKALRAMAIHLEDDEERSAQLVSLINRVVETYPGRQTWNIDLLYQAIRNRWPDWAMQSLPLMRHVPGKYTGQIFDTLRLCADSSPRAVAGILAHNLTVIEKNLVKDDPIKTAIEKAHKDSLKNLAVGASGRV